MGADPVVDVDGFHEPRVERGAVGDLVAVEVLVLDRLEDPLDHAVGLGSLVAGADVLELDASGEEPREPVAFNAARCRSRL